MTNLSGANLNNGAAVGPQVEGRDSPSNFPKYPAYKDSGDEWLSEVPEHWEVLPLKHFAEVDNSGCYGVEPADGVHIRPVATTAQIDSEGRFDVGRMSDRGFSAQELARYECSPGDVLVVKSSGSAENIISGKAGLVRIDTPPFVFSNFLMRLRHRKDICLPSFLYSLLISHLTRERIKQMCSTTTYPNLQVGLYTSAKLPCPPLNEQTQIARFLDHETARIDALIEEQHCLIELLKEKRQAVISHAVTKGLDPKVPMKDSGVEWLGEVPAHWDVVCVKHIKSWRPNAFVDGPFGSNLKSEHFVDDGGVYVIESNFATTGELSFSDLKQISPNHFETIRRSEVCAGDIVIAKIGARYGMCSILPWLDKPAVVSGNSLKLTVNEEVCDSRFAVFVLKHLKERGAIEDIVNMTAQPALSLGEMNNLPFPLPPLCDQLSIVSDLEIRLGEFEALTSECRQVVSLAIERRSALISAAVTGKIDVRGWQPSASVPTPELAQEAV